MGEKEGMQVRFLLGPAGSGKTFRCLADIQSTLMENPEGNPLLFLSPKQATFQLESQLLQNIALPGYTRLKILSFERLAFHVINQLTHSRPQILDENGRVMVLRALIAQNQDKLECFTSTSQLPGFIQQLSGLLHDCIQQGLGPDQMATLLDKSILIPSLTQKIRDLRILTEAYHQWLFDRGLHDGNDLLNIATDLLKKANKAQRCILNSETGEDRIAQTSFSLDFGKAAPSKNNNHVSAPRPLKTKTCSALNSHHPSDFKIAGLWLDGFAELTFPEMKLLLALLPFCDRALLAFCLRNNSPQHWLSPWSIVSSTFHKCLTALQALPGVELVIETMNSSETGRFITCPALAHLESHWDRVNPPPFTPSDQTQLKTSLKRIRCTHPEAEVINAAQEIREFVENGGRYRDCGILLRTFDGYHETIRRIFNRYSIPIFIDRRESIAHHPLAELTRYSLRIWIHGWCHEDLFGALKTGLFPLNDEEIDFLENETLAHGWKGDVWAKPIRWENKLISQFDVNILRHAIVPLFVQFGRALLGTNADQIFLNAATPDWPCIGMETQVHGARLANSIRLLWDSLRVHERLEYWSKQTADDDTTQSPPFHTIHHTVWTQMLAWLDNLSLAFSDVSLSLRLWQDILETGMSGLTVGIIPPVVDQVLVGVVDRSRNPDLKLTLVLGLNEGVFPATPSISGLLNEAELSSLEESGFPIALNRRTQIAKEKYLGYISFTRPRNRLILSHCERNDNDKVLNPSSFFTSITQLFPTLEEEEFISSCITIRTWTDLIPYGLRQGSSPAQWHEEVLQNASEQIKNQINLIRCCTSQTLLKPEVASILFGDCLAVSATQLEWYAECPFKFFTGWSLEADERKMFELDSRKEGSFQHAVLAEFHHRLFRCNKRWRDIDSSEARSLIREIAQNISASYHEGILHSNASNEFVLSGIITQLQDFAAAIVTGMVNYGLDPHLVEISYGHSWGLPEWVIDLKEKKILSISGKIDRVDSLHSFDKHQFFLAVYDYKSSYRNFDSLLFSAGIQMQLPLYLHLLLNASDSLHLPAGTILQPVGAFYSNLAGKYEAAADRSEALSTDLETTQKAFQYRGRFDPNFLRLLDIRMDNKKGTQFKYLIKKDGQLSISRSDIFNHGSFQDFLNQTEIIVRKLGEQILNGCIQVDPYQKGTSRACQGCLFNTFCRIDPWTHKFRIINNRTPSIITQPETPLNDDE